MTSYMKNENTHPEVNFYNFYLFWFLYKKGAWREVLGNTAMPGTSSKPYTNIWAYWEVLLYHVCKRHDKYEIAL